MSRERTHQQLDPIAGLETRPVTLLIATGVFTMTLVLDSVRWHQVTDFALAISALALLGVACLTVVVVSAPSRAPVSRAAHMAMYVPATAAIVLDTAGRWGASAADGTNPMALAIGALLVAMAPYRPARELAAAGVLASLLIGFVALLHSSAIDAPNVVHIITWSVPVLSLGLAAAAFASAMVVAIENWQRRADAASREATQTMEQGIAKSVQQDRVTILNQDVVPFFVGLLDRDRLTPEDRARAGEISDSIRRLMVAEVDRTWLDDVVRDLAEGRIDARAVRDSQRLAQAMSTHQRAAFRALLVAVCDMPGFDPGFFAVSITASDPGLAWVNLTVRVEAPEASPRSALAPYLAAIRVMFREVTVDRLPSALAVRFCYAR